MLSDLFWNEHKTRLSCLGKITMDYSSEIEKGILMRIVSFFMRMISTFEAFYEKDDKEG